MERLVDSSEFTHLTERHIIERHAITLQNLITWPQAGFSCQSIVFSELYEYTWFPVWTLADPKTYNFILLVLFVLFHRKKKQWALVCCVCLYETWAARQVN